MKQVAIVGYGEIARKEHEPAINDSDAFQLACTVSIDQGHAELPNFKTITDAINSGIEIDLFALCVPPGIRISLAREAVAAGKSVLLEKPPAVNEDELDELRLLAERNDVSVFTAWHSKYALMVPTAKALLADKAIQSIEIVWKESVDVWHPGQEWIWKNGGYGVFDSGSNAFSILTELLDSDISFVSGMLKIESIHEMPSQAKIEGDVAGVDFIADLDWRWNEKEVWELRFKCENNDVLLLSDGGTKLFFNGDEIISEITDYISEYSEIYRKMDKLLLSGESEIDSRPMKICLDALSLSVKTFIQPCLDKDECHPIQLLDSRRCELGEGLFWHPMRKQLFWFDILSKKLLSNKDDKEIEWCFDCHISAAGWIDQNRLLLASDRGLLEFDIETTATKVLVEVESDRMETRSNDGRTDRVGGFWFSTMGKHAESALGTLYRYYKGHVLEVYTGITIPNTICFSPDGSVAYFSDTSKQLIWKQKLCTDTGEPEGDREVWLDFSGTDFYPDGGDVDKEGNVWIAFWGLGRIEVYNSQGQKIRQIGYPASNVSCPLLANGRLYAVSALQCLSEKQRADEVYSGMTFEMLLNSDFLEVPRVLL
ncbi:SMP-30/gluconolactonase/LRE family protein [Thalassolituus sp.]|uniref:SMP-30/gluconolactonase/LRE family protein n=1 Tax=Thalassolituus sp. TaxID=2030822 RepID=UPI002A82720E|nr:SMP-30/gluconolactonase/LRE family protein [Thalassolituus sp.]